MAPTQPLIRQCREGDTEAMLAIINAAAEAYRGVIPSDCWHEPYMPEAELRAEIAARVRFMACEVDEVVVGVMGIQPVRNVDLIRHAYVSPACQRLGVGGALMATLRERSTRQVLVGTWAAATWAIKFYERHGFRLVPDTVKAALLKSYWTISPRQIEVSVVMAAPPLDAAQARTLMA
jgi:N-acetylglutamate synthase-like GNAT family acetyltransferase